jgi:hypothetical protein
MLRGVTWRWRPGVPRRIRKTPPIGVIAQDVEKVFPELVTTGRDGYKRVHYAGLIGPLIEAVKELDERLSEVERRLGPSTDHPEHTQQPDDERS